MEGFLGTGATFGADLNLLVQVTMAMALGGGAWLARRRYYFAHGCVQASVVVANLFFIVWVMLPSFSRQVAPQVPRGLSDRYYLIAFAHAVVGAVAELLAIYVVLVAGTKVIPGALRFKNFKPWMRTTLALWWLAAGLGFTTYAMWYVTPPGSKVNSNRAPMAQKVRVEIRNFRFDPKDVVVASGTTVEWTDAGGRHMVEAEDGSFKSETLTAGGKFEHRFERAGTFPYFCTFHGSKGGHDMVG